jgi:hypothetical protein
VLADIAGTLFIQQSRSGRILVDHPSGAIDQEYRRRKLLDQCSCLKISL